MHKPKRLGFKLDMTPLVDVAFLLLTFFMFTAKFKSETENQQKFEITRPTASADTTKVPEINAAIVKIGLAPGSPEPIMTYALTNASDRLAVFQAVPGIPPEEQSKVEVTVRDTNMLGQLVLATRIQNSKTKFLIDGDKKVKYGKIEQVMNIFRSKGQTIFNFVTVKNEGGAPAK